MKIFLKFVFFVILLLIVGGMGFLATWDMPPPSTKIEKVLPNDRFPR